jgi:hypothetical protein
MNDTVTKTIYILFGVVNLLFAVFFTLGAAFSSYAVSGLVVLLADLPLALGLMAAFQPRKVFSLLMMLGCTTILVYIGVVTYYTRQRGLPPLPFHIIWASASVLEAVLAFISFRKLHRRNGVMTWPQ